MRNVLTSLLILMSFLATGQVTIAHTANVTPSAAPQNSSNSYSDDFESYTTSASIDGQGDWITMRGTIEINTHGADKAFDGGDNYFNLAYYNQPVDDNQYSEINVEAKLNYACPGPAVRIASSGYGTAYIWFSENSTSAYLVRLVNGSPSYLVTGTSGWSSGDVVRLEISGDEISMIRNGSLDTSMSGDGKYSDSSGSKLTSGSVGIMVYEMNNNAWGDNWEGGDL